MSYGFAKRMSVTGTPGSAFNNAISAELSSAYLLTRCFRAAPGDQFVDKGYALGHMPAHCDLGASDDRSERIHHHLALDDRGADA